MTVHVLHLVPGWQDALREFRRVLTPEGVYLNVKTWAPAGVSSREQVRLHWRGWLQEHGHEIRHPGLEKQEELNEALTSMNAQVREVEVIRYTLEFTLREELERFATRIYSETWDIPEELFERRNLETWTIPSGTSSALQLTSFSLRAATMEAHRTSSQRG
jgi:ubiquinone/menaquinone biosynthesis C-methylase UbiE